MIKQISYNIARCDICGEELGFTTLYTFQYDDGWRVLKVDSNVEGEGKRLEICPECVDTVIKFINNEKSKIKSMKSKKKEGDA